MQRCIVCDSKGTKPFGSYKWKLWDVDYTVLECGECGTVFTDPMPDDEVLSRVYKECFDYRWYEDHYNAKYRDCKIRLEEYKGMLGRRVLDFGGGVGYFSKAANDLGYVSRTYDPFKDRNDRAEGRWDTVVALHVLEHSNNLDRTMNEIKSLLEPGGNVILAVPNLACKGYRELGMGWVWAQPPLLHIFHFTVEGLKKLLSLHGFTGIKISYHERWDANLYTDLEKVSAYRMLDSLWGKKLINRFAFARKRVAEMNSFLRFRGLKKALEGYDPSDDKYSELQVTARKEG